MKKRFAMIAAALTGAMMISFSAVPASAASNQVDEQYVTEENGQTEIIEADNVETTDDTEEGDVDIAVTLEETEETGSTEEDTVVETDEEETDTESVSENASDKLGPFFFRGYPSVCRTGFL